MGEWNVLARPSTLILAAHPDDETIFFGGLLLSFPEWEWHIVCITMENSHRLKSYEKAMKEYKKAGVNINSYCTLGLTDKRKTVSPAELDVWLSGIEALKLNPSLVFTHNKNGEYGHPQHAAANRAAHKIYKNVWDCWCPGEEFGPTQHKREKVNKVPLPKEILMLKNKIFNIAYKSEKAGLLTGLPEIMKYEFETGPEVYTQ